MPRSKNKSKRKGARESSWSNEVAGILFVGSGLLLLLSLISYTAADLPIKVPFTDWSLLGNYGALEMEANSPRQNFIGPVGTLIGFAQIQLLGGAAYLLPLGLIWMGVARLFMEAEFTVRTWIGFGVFLLSGGLPSRRAVDVLFILAFALCHRGAGRHDREGSGGARLQESPQHPGFGDSPGDGLLHEPLHVAGGSSIQVREGTLLLDRRDGWGPCGNVGPSGT